MDGRPFKRQRKFAFCGCGNDHHPTDSCTSAASSGNYGYLSHPEYWCEPWFQLSAEMKEVHTAPIDGDASFDQLVRLLPKNRWDHIFRRKISIQCFTMRKSSGRIYRLHSKSKNLALQVTKPQKSILSSTTSQRLPLMTRQVRYSAYEEQNTALLTSSRTCSLYVR